MPTLNWVGKDKVVNHHHDVPFRVLRNESTFRAPAGTPDNTTDDRDNTDSELKLKLGKLWEAKVGRDYHYMMVFENNPIVGAERLSDALKKLGQM